MANDKIVKDLSKLSDEELMQLLQDGKALEQKARDDEFGLTDEDLRIREDCEKDLYTFFKYAWRNIDPSEYIDGWHLQCIAEHLQAQIRGEIRHLLINVPPRHAKSLLGSVAVAPWVWAQRERGPLSGPDISFLYASYAQTLSHRDSMKARRLILSPWYQKLWGGRFQLSDDLNTKGRFENDAGGYRIATSVGGQLTGDGANILTIDDAHNSVEIESDIVRQGVLDWWDQSFSTRHNRPKTDIFTVIMQRLNQNDLAGHILERADSSWTHLMLPARYDSSRHCSTSIGFSDPRTEDGELLWPERLGEKEVRALEIALGEFGSAGQLQQIPAPKGGGLIKDSWWNPWTEKVYPATLEFIIASADTAYTEKEENDYSACVVMGVYRDKNDMPKIIIMDAWQSKLALHDLVIKLGQTAKKFKVDRLIIENKASGISVEQELRRMFRNEVFGIVMNNPKGDKVARLISVEPMFAEGMVYIPFDEDGDSGRMIPKEWADMLMTNVSQFPKGRYKDIVDALSQGMKYLRDNGLILRQEEYEDDMNSRLEYTGHKEPLYDV